MWVKILWNFIKSTKMYNVYMLNGVLMFFPICETINRCEWVSDCCLTSSEKNVQLQNGENKLPLDEMTMTSTLH